MTIETKASEHACDLKDTPRVFQKNCRSFEPDEGQKRQTERPPGLAEGRERKFRGLMMSKNG
jgi:hypothetical protein